MKIELTLEETNILQGKLQRMGEKYSKKLSFNQLLFGWENLVEEIERGYSGCSYEYFNDLSIRSFFDELMLELPEVLVKKIKGLLQPLDKKFIDATIDVSSTPKGNFGELAWEKRIPKKRTQNF